LLCNLLRNAEEGAKGKQVGGFIFFRDPYATRKEKGTHRAVKRERQLRSGIINEDRYRMSLASLIGYASFANSLQLRRNLINTK